MSTRGLVNWLYRISYLYKFAFQVSYFKFNNTFRLFFVFLIKFLQFNIKVLFICNCVSKYLSLNINAIIFHYFLIEYLLTKNQWYCDILESFYRNWNHLNQKRLINTFWLLSDWISSCSSRSYKFYELSKLFFNLTFMLIHYFN